MNNEQESFGKIAIIIVALLWGLIMLNGCRKQEITIDAQVGMMYHIKSNVFSKGAYQPKQPVRIERIYTDPNSGYLYAEVTDMDDTQWFIPIADLK